MKPLPKETAKDVAAICKQYRTAKGLNFSDYEILRNRYLTPTQIEIAHKELSRA